MILSWNFHYASDFELKKNKVSDFEIIFFSSGQILNKKFNNVSDFNFKILKS